MTTSADLRALAVAAIKSAAIVPSGSVFSPRDWPSYAGQLPMILVQTPREEKQSLGRNVPQFTTMVTLAITARAKAVAGAADAGAVTAELAVENLKNAIEQALINDFNLTAVIQQFSFVRSVIKVDAEGEYHIGELTQEYGLETYQGPEDFAPPAAVPLDRVTATAEELAGTIEPAIDMRSLQGVPVAPAASAVGGAGEITVTFSTSQFSDTRNLYWSTTTGVTPLTGTKIAAVSSPYVHSGRAAGTEYFYVATAVNSAGEGPASAQMNATTNP